MDVGSALKNAIGDLRGRCNKMLATIKDDQCPSGAQKVEQRICAIDKPRVGPERGGDGADDLLLVSSGRKIDKENRAGEVRQRRVSDGQSNRRFAHAASTQNGNQTFRLEPGLNLKNNVFATHHPDQC